MRRKSTWIVMAIAILFTIGCVGTGVMLVDDRTASMAMGDEDRTTAPAISQEGLATGRILGREYTFPVPSREQMTEIGEQALNVIPPEIRLGAAGIGHVSQWIADAVQAALQWITGET